MSIKWTREHQLELDHFTERVKHLEQIKSEAKANAVAQATSSLRKILTQTCGLLGDSWTNDEIDEVMRHIVLDLAGDATDDITNLLTYIREMKGAELL